MRTLHRGLALSVLVVLWGAIPAGADDSCTLTACMNATVEGHHIDITAEMREAGVVGEGTPAGLDAGNDSDFTAGIVEAGDRPRVTKVERFPTGDNLSCAYFRPGGGEVRTCYPGRLETEEQDPSAGVSSEEVMRSAVERVSVEGAGLVVNPSRRVFAGLPVLVHASRPVVSTSVDVLGLTVEVELRAREFEYNFHNGHPPLVTSDPGRPYPDKSLFQIYEQPLDDAYITLKTTWSAQVWHPVTGESMIVTGALVTYEDSVRFNVTKPRTRLVLPGTSPQQ